MNQRLESFIDLSTKAKNTFASNYKDNYSLSAKCSQWVHGVKEWSRSDIREVRRNKETATANFINKYYKKVLSELTQAEVSLSVHPTSYIKSDQLKANRDLLEHIILNSDNQKVFHSLIDSCLSKGFGVARVFVDFESKNSMNRVLKICSLNNITGCFFDLSSTDPTMSDGRFCGQKNFVKLSKLYQCYGVNTKKYGNVEAVEVTDFFYKQSRKVNFYKVGPGSWVSEDKMDPLQLQSKKKYQSTQRSLNEVWFTRFTDKEFLIEPGLFYEGEALPMFYWPMCTDLVQIDSPQMAGSGSNYEVKRVVSPFVKPMLGVQECYNYALSQATTLLANAIGTKWIVTPEQIAGFEEYWSQINTVEGPVRVNADEGVPTQVQVITTEPIHQTLLNFMDMMKNAFNELSGIYELAQGADDSTISGVAADIKVSQANASNAVYLQKHVRAINTLGAGLMEMISSFYVEKRVFFLEDNNVFVMNEIVRKDDQFVVKNSVNDLFDKMQVRVGSGAPARQDRKYNVGVLTTLMQNQNFAQHLPMFADVLIENMEITNKDLLLKRMQSMLGPDLYKLSKGDTSLDEYFNTQIKQQKDVNAQQSMLMEMQQKMMQIEGAVKSSKAELQMAKAVEAKAKAQEIIAETPAPANPQEQPPVAGKSMSV